MAGSSTCSAGTAANVSASNPDLVNASPSIASVARCSLRMKSTVGATVSHCSAWRSLGRHGRGVVGRQRGADLAEQRVARIAVVALVVEGLGLVGDGDGDGDLLRR